MAWPTGGFRRLVCFLLFLTASVRAPANEPKPAIRNKPSSQTTVADLIKAIRSKAKLLERSSGMRQGYQAFLASYKLSSGAVSYSNFVTVRLLFEATRDAGFWNLHWTITDKPPTSDEIWRQWKSVHLAYLSAPTASAECDELSALYAFLAVRAGVHGVGLFWPTFNHTVAVWEIHPPTGTTVRVVVPTSQIFLDETDSFGTKKFDPWRQKTIHEYTHRDVAGSFEIPRPLYEFFLLQVDKYAGASDLTLQRLRYLRDGVFRNEWTAEAAAREALKRRDELKSSSTEDLKAYQNFAEDMRSGLLR